MILVVSSTHLSSKNSEQCSLFLCIALRLPYGFVILFLLTACQADPPDQTLKFNGLIMGTDYQVTVVVPPGYQAERLEPQIAVELQAVNSSMSTYLKDSEVIRFNNLAANTPFKVSAQLQLVLSEALQISKLSNGAFDITVGELVNLWGFGPDGIVTQQPDTQQIEALRASIGYQNLKLNADFLSKTYTATTIDLSAIAKGFAVDQVTQMLKQKGLNNFLVEVGGELRASGVNASRLPWRIAIEKPQEPGGVQEVIKLQDQAIATSGDYRNYLTIQGKKYSHTIDPRTLRPVYHRLSLVSVVSEKASTADALATTLMVMGEEQGMVFAEKHNLAAYFIIRASDEVGFEVKYTRKFASLF